MAKVYGSESKYLIIQHDKSSRKYDTFRDIFFGLIIFASFILFIGQFIHPPLWLKILLPVLGLYILIFYLRKKDQEKNTEKWKQGIEGETEVVKELQKLGDNFAIFKDLKQHQKNFNIDILVSGPTGIFVIEVKSYKKFLPYSPEFPKVLQQTSKSALTIHKHLQISARSDVFIKPLLVYSSDEAKVVPYKAKHAITVLHKSNLCSYILSQPDISKKYNVLQLENHLILLTGHNII